LGDDLRVLRVIQLIAPEKLTPEPWELRALDR